MRSLARLAVFALVQFVLLVASARVVRFGPRGLDPRRYPLIRDVAPGSLVTYETAPGLVYEYRPNLDLFFEGARFRTNARGMADAEVTLEKPVGAPARRRARQLLRGASRRRARGCLARRAGAPLRRALAPHACEFLEFAVGMHGRASSS